MQKKPWKTLEKTNTQVHVQNCPAFYTKDLSKVISTKERSKT